MSDQQDALPAPSESANGAATTNGQTFDPITEPVLNTPYEQTKWHWALDTENRAMPDRRDGRRQSVAILPVPEEHDPDKPPEIFDLAENEQFLNETVNDIRGEVSRWRETGRYEGATAASKRLLKHWKSEERQPRLFFAQIEALETLIWLTEVAPAVTQSGSVATQREQSSAANLLEKVSEASRSHNDGIERRAIKMATGTGKTVVMGMVIAWHAANAFEAHKLPEEQRNRYLTSFVAITPGHTVRERLETLKPSPQGGVRSVYDEMGLLPEQYKDALGRVQVQIVNFQKFKPKDRLADATGVTKQLLRKRSNRAASNRNASSNDKDSDKKTKVADLEERSAMLRRVLRGMRGPVCVLNDEAHHCYLPAQSGTSPKAKRSKEDKEEDEAAALWFNAIRSLSDSDQLGAVYDFSATPMFIQTTGRAQSQMFPWVVSDYPLMDAIEAGLVKIPRVPVKDDTQDAATEEDNPLKGKAKWRNLYKHVDAKKNLDKTGVPPKLTDAIKTFYKTYEAKSQAWESKGIQVPPVFIVVANNIVNASALYHYLSGTRTALEDDSGDDRGNDKDNGGAWKMQPSEFDLFSNFGNDNDYAPNLNTLLVHSKLEGEDKIGTTNELGRMLSAQAVQLKRRVEQLADEGKDVSGYENLMKSPQELVRRALNTVGRPGELGANIRCVVSVSMLTEGWDTRSVTHVLGYRAFGTQLLCEQVTGRALRRTTYDDFDEQGRLEPQFAEVLGIPFDFMPVGDALPPDTPPKEKYVVESVPGRHPLRIEFPLLTGYLVEPGGIGIKFNAAEVKPYQLDTSVPDETTVSGITGEESVIKKTTTDARHQQVVTKVAARVVSHLQSQFASEGGNEGIGKDWTMPRSRQLFSEAVPVVEQWLEHSEVDIPADQLHRLCGDTEADQAAKQVVAVCVSDLSRNPVSKRIGTFVDGDFLVSTEDIWFETSRQDRYPEKDPDLLDSQPLDEAGTRQTKNSELNIAACDSSWEVHVAKLLDDHQQVQAWARNTPQPGPDFKLPYEFEGTWHDYYPDFVARIGGDHEDPGAIYLLIEVKGIPDDRSMKKAEYAQEWWIPAVCNSPQTPAHLRNWKWLELAKDPDQFYRELDQAIKAALAARNKKAGK